MLFCYSVAMQKVMVLTLMLRAGAWADVTTYQKPNDAVLRVLDAPVTPTAVMSPTRDRVMLVSPVVYPPIEGLAKPLLKLAGIRLNPQSHAPHSPPHASSFTVLRISDGGQQRVLTPLGSKLGPLRWRSDGLSFAFVVYAEAGEELWLGDAVTGKVRKVPGIRLNSLLGGHHVQWMPDQNSLLLKLVPMGFEVPRWEAGTPSGPTVQESTGASGSGNTYEKRDVLQSPHEENLFEHFARSQIARVDIKTGKVTRVGKPGLYASVLPSPDGKHVLVDSVHRPYSYLTGFHRFPTDTEVWDGNGKLERVLFSRPLADAVSMQGVVDGARAVAWQPLEPATAVWMEALDGGDWKTKVPHRDRLMLQRWPFQQPAVELLRTESRLEGLVWTQAGHAIAGEHDVIRHWNRTWWVSSGTPKLLWERSSDDRYADPGIPVKRTISTGFQVVEQEGDVMYLRGEGASPDGDRPFLDRFNLKTLKRERLFRCDKTSYEVVIDWVNGKAGQLLTRRESPTEPPNFYLRTLGEPVVAVAGEGAWSVTGQALTAWVDHTPELRGITKQIVRYQRADGLDLSFTLFLPPGAKPGVRLPTVLWAYPRDFANREAAGQVSGSTQRFTTLTWPLQLFFLLDGYAVIDNPSIPVVGDSKKMYDTYLEQLVAGARAAVNQAIEMGVTDPDRVGVSGHSHGGLMTANLLAHSDLFRAGIARSGAYNRSLTAFGFQNENRSWWEAPEVYLKVSPFFAANKIKTPLMLIHGSADPNPGTEPVQSEKFYEAIRGNGGTVKLVMLPLEGHGYSSRESIEHVLYESLSWFERYVKNAPPRSQ
jgi:dipeptidyl aminopeptidase/acylaminoacyl peptidase